jgi:hypothetical protein
MGKIIKRKLYVNKK